MSPWCFSCCLIRPSNLAWECSMNNASGFWEHCVFPWWILSPSNYLVYEYFFSSSSDYLKFSEETHILYSIIKLFLLPWNMRKLTKLISPSHYPLTSTQPKPNSCWQVWGSQEDHSVIFVILIILAAPQTISTHLLGSYAIPIPGIFPWHSFVFLFNLWNEKDLSHLFFIFFSGKVI